MMVSAFNLEKLKNLLHDFYEISKIRITVFNERREEIVAYPEEIPDVCKVIRSCESGSLACAVCDKDACERAAKQRRTQIYRCHAGLTEAVTPLVIDGALIGYLFFGHVFSYPDYESGWEEIMWRCKDFPIDIENLREACLTQPIISQEYVESATHILLAVASYLVLERMATLRGDRLAVQLDKYLSAHFTEDFTAAELCSTFGIGKTKLYKLSQELYGCGVSEHIRDLRLMMAKNLLHNHRELSLKEIADHCGFIDYNYFIAVFSHAESCPPGEWRKTHS